MKNFGKFQNYMRAVTINSLPGLMMYQQMYVQMYVKIKGYMSMTQELFLSIYIDHHHQHIILCDCSKSIKGVNLIHI